MRWSLWQEVMLTDAYRDRKMRKFEYKVINRLVGVEKRLNQLGYEGWELVAYEGGKFIFKREYKE